MPRRRSRTPRISSRFEVADSTAEACDLADPSDDTNANDTDASDADLGSESYAWHFDMLHDVDRLEAFSDAFDRLPSAARSGLALDIGCGSGILGLALLKKHPRIPRVLAFERDPKLAEVARRNALKNGLGSKLQVHAVPSTSMTLQRRAKLVVAEILDAALLGEDCLGTLRHASQNLLQEDYFAIPAAADVVACAVESATLAVLQRAESAWWAPKAYRQDPGDANPHDVVLDKLVEAGQARVLTKAFPVLSFNFERLPSSRSQRLEVEMLEPGRVDAIVFWWQCYMLRGDQTPNMTNAPTWAHPHHKKAPEIGHWRQAVCVLPRGRLAEAGEKLSIMAFHTDEDIWFRILENDSVQLAPIPLPKGSSNLGLMSPQRLWMLSDVLRYRCIQHAVDLAVKSLKLHPSFAIQVLDLSDGPIMTLLCLQSLRKKRRRLPPRSRPWRRLLQVSGLGPCRIISLESNEEDLQVATEVLEPWSKKSLGKGFWPPKVLQLLGSPNLGKEMISMVCGEPFARECEGLPCDSALWHHWAQVDALRFSLMSSCILLPRFFRVKLALLGCHDLWRRRQVITEPVQGIDVSAINDLHPDVGRRLRFPCNLWQVDHMILSEAVTLCSVDMQMPFPSAPHEFPEVTLRSTQKSGKVDGLVTWTEICFHPDSGWVPTVGISRRDAARCFEPSPFMQGVLLAKKPRCDGLKVTVQASFDAEDGSLSLGARWSDGSDF